MNILIFANGKCRNTKELSYLASQADTIIAADGGANHCEKLKITPDILIGDLDSIDPKLLERYEKSQMTIHRHPRRKNATDLELALDLAAHMDAAFIYISGALGGRWDMSLANIQLCASAKYRALEVLLLGEDCTITILHAGKKYKVQGPAGRTVSLVPLNKEVKGVTLSGFEYPLEDADIAFGSSLGISNVIQTEPASVQLSSGILALIEFPAVNLDPKLLLPVKD